MPHIIIEHSANLADLTDMDALVAAVHRAALDDGLPALAGLRTRTAPRDRYQIADGNPAYGFVCLTARIAPGREPEAVQRFLTRLIDTVEGVLEPLQPEHPMAISAEIELIDTTMRINRNHVRTHLAQHGLA